MLKETRADDKYDEKILTVIERLELSGYEDIRADVENHEAPARLIRKRDNLEFTPDITAKKMGAKHYFEIAKKTKDKRKLAGKWKLLSQLAEMKDGVFRIFVPYGNMKFTNELLAKHEIQAEVSKL